MFVVPFYTKSQLPSLIKWSLVPITLFVDNRGKQICETDEPDLWLAENDFAVKSKWREGKILYVDNFPLQQKHMLNHHLLIRTHHL